jgi:hypothetical protein
MPDLVRYQLWQGSHACAATTERGEVERLARACETVDCDPCLDRTVIETRFTVVRSREPGTVATIRKLRDYLPPQEQRGPMASGGFE